MRLRLREPLLYWWLRLCRALDRRPRPAEEIGTPAIRRILAVSCTALGDTLLSTPALTALRQAYPAAHIALLVHPSVQCLFDGLPDIDETIPYSGKWRDFGRTVRRLRRQPWDLAVILHGNEPQATPLTYMAGARHIFKIPNTSRWNFLLSNRTPLVGWDDFVHGVDQRLAVAQLAGAGNIADRRMSVVMSAAGEAALSAALAERGWTDTPIVAFQPGASTNSRRWPRSRFIAAALALRTERPDVRFIITGSPAEAMLCREIAAGINAAASDVAWASAGELPLSALPALLRRSSLLLSGDTGPMHLAVAVGTPVIALFAVSSAARSGPSIDHEHHVIIQKWRTCNPCHSKHCAYPEPICMDNISVDEVLDALLTVLTRELA